MTLYASKSDGIGGVICGCAAAICCPYPWPDPNGEDGGPFYPDTDLPDTVRLFMVDPPSNELLHRVGYNYYNDADVKRIESDASPEWILAFLEPSAACLIGTFGVEGDYTEDQFPNTLFINGTTEITRDPDGSGCIWTDGVGNDLDYGTSNPYKFSLNGVAKDDPQNTPEGSYGADTVAA